MLSSLASLSVAGKIKLDCGYLVLAGQLRNEKDRRTKVRNTKRNGRLRAGLALCFVFGSFATSFLFPLIVLRAARRLSETTAGRNAALPILLPRKERHENFRTVPVQPTNETAAGGATTNAFSKSADRLRQAIAACGLYRPTKEHDRGTQSRRRKPALLLRSAFFRAVTRAIRQIRVQVESDDRQRSRSITPRTPAG